MRIKLTLEYDGSNYSGWQLQKGQDSVQARIEAVLEQIFSGKIRIHGAGRTDAGVHACGQVAAFKLPRPFDAGDLKRALNALLPADIAVLEAAAAADEFDPRRDARSRLYEYRVLNQPIRSAFEYRHVWLVREPLDLTVMNEAARVFLGEHDFAAFRTLGSEEKTTVRRVYRSEWRRDGTHFIYTVEATAFLRHMVRTMTGAMVEAGRGRIEPGAIAALLAGRDRAMVPAAAPARGLFLIAVRY
ncbi:MAG: tRNA pseudouridine(38-40) synthase TruA [Candidatus Binataceae bacterium]